MSNDMPVRDQVSAWRQKVIDGTITDEEAIAAVNIMRGDRRAAADAAEKRGTKAPKITFDSDSILDGE